MRFLTSVVLAVALAAPSISFAKGGKPWSNPDDPGGRWSNSRSPSHPAHVASPAGAKFISNDQIAVRHYYSAAFGRGFCPPGLAKKRNGCLPPGHARRWVIGAPLAAGIVWYSVPHALVVRLSAPPVGFRYVYLDGAVLLFNPATRLVADGVTINVNIR